MLQEPVERGSGAWSALRGERPPRRWPWALLAALTGAAAGAAAVAVVRRVEGVDAPDAQEPHELRAVVDRRPAAS